MDSANECTDAHRRIAKRRARHTRALARALGDASTHLKASREDVDNEDDVEDEDEDPRETVARVARDAAETLRRERNAFVDIERDAAETFFLEFSSESAVEPNTDSLRTMTRIAREREASRQESVRETRYRFRRDMIDDAEASGETNDELVEAWNNLLRENAETTCKEGDGDRVDCMELDARFRAQLSACKRALEPKESLVLRLRAHTVANVDASFDDALVECRRELAHAATLAAHARTRRETAFQSLLTGARASFDETLRRRDELRSRALEQTDALIEAERRSREEDACREANARRASLMSTAIENAREMRRLRDRLDHRVEDTSARLHDALARAPLRSARLKDALRRRRDGEAQRRARERLATRVMKNLRVELHRVKREYAEREKSEAALGAASVRSANRSLERLNAARCRPIGTDKTAAIRAMKHARIAQLQRELDAAEREIWRTALGSVPPKTFPSSLQRRAEAYERLERAMRRRD